MMVSGRPIIASVLLPLFLASSALAAPKQSWDGKWSGKWGDEDAQATSVTIANGKVESFEYQGVSTPVPASKVTPTTVSYDYNGVSIVMKRTGATTATATLHSSQGDATAKLNKQ
jgi:hypothetical protein